MIIGSCSHKEPAHILPTTPNLAGCVIADDGPTCHTTRDKMRRNGASMTNWLRKGTRIYRPNNAVHKCHRKRERPLRQKEFECIRTVVSLLTLARPARLVCLDRKHCHSPIGSHCWQAWSNDDNYRIHQAWHDDTASTPSTVHGMMTQP